MKNNKKTERREGGERERGGRDESLSLDNMFAPFRSFVIVHIPVSRSQLFPYRFEAFLDKYKSQIFDKYYIT